MTGSAAEAFARGEPALFVNEIRDVGVVGVPIDLVTPDVLNYLFTSCRGIVYVALPEDRLLALGIERQAQTGSGPEHLYVPVDALRDVTTGISAADRNETVHRLVDPAARPTDFRQPGHITPMAMHPDGILARTGLAESILEAARWAGRSTEAVVFCAVLTEDGHMADVDQLATFAAREGLSMNDLAWALRERRRESGWEQEPDDVLELSYVDWAGQVATRGAAQVHDEVPVRVVPLCAAGHALGSCRCSEQREQDRAWFAAAPAAALVVTWPRSGVPTCDRVLSDQVRRGVASLIAADHFGARAVLDDGQAGS